jgi:hypothetical protein
MAVDLAIVLLIVAYVVIGFIAWQILKKVIGVVITLSIFTTIVLLVFTFFVYKDIVDFKANLRTGNSILLIEDNIALSGFTVIGEEGQVLSKEQLAIASSHYGKGELKQLKGSTYKLFVLSPGFIEAMESPSFTLEDDPLTKEQTLAIMRSSDAVKTAAGFGISSDETSEDVKAELLTQVFEEGIQNPIFMISRVKDGSMKVHPESALFKGMKYIPLTFIKSAVSKMASETKEAASDITAKVVATVRKSS